MYWLKLVTNAIKFHCLKLPIILGTNISANIHIFIIRYILRHQKYFIAVDYQNELAGFIILTITLPFNVFFHFQVSQT